MTSVFRYLIFSCTIFIDSFLQSMSAMAFEPPIPILLAAKDNSKNDEPKPAEKNIKPADLLESTPLKNLFGN